MMFYCILTPCYCILNCISNNQGAQATQGEQVALFVPTSSAALGIAFKASLMLCSHLHEQSGSAAHVK